jgi:hypothetical protein
MEIISPVNSRRRQFVKIKMFPYLFDHCFTGRTILPAVESLTVLAKITKVNYPQTDVSCMSQARFPHFLPINPAENNFTVLVENLKESDSTYTAALFTATKSKTNKISRIVEHAFVRFTNDGRVSCPQMFFRNTEKLAGKCISIPSHTVYRELIPFGEAYQNITGDLSVSPDGALGYVSGGDNEADDSLLGSPFPFDAIMHMGCVWGQRFTGTVPFPVGFEKRIIHLKTRKGDSYLGRIMPVNITSRKLIFDAWIYNMDGVLFEFISSLVMQVATTGHLRPPQWIML